jgi:thioredoxin 1
MNLASDIFKNIIYTYYICSNTATIKMGHMKVLRSQDDITRVIKKACAKELPTVVKFYAPWCGPCKLIAPWFESFAESYDGAAKFASMNIDLDDDVAKTYNIRTIPAFCIFNRAGKLVSSFGSEPAEVEKSLRNCIARKDVRDEPLESELENYGDDGDNGDDENDAGAKSPVASPIVKLERSPADRKWKLYPTDSAETEHSVEEELEKDLDNSFAELDELPGFVELMGYIKAGGCVDEKPAARKRKTCEDSEFDT